MSRPALYAPYSPVTEPTAPFAVLVHNSGGDPRIACYAKQDGRPLAVVHLPRTLTEDAGASFVRIDAVEALDGYVLATTRLGAALFGSAGR